MNDYAKEVDALRGDIARLTRLEEQGARPSAILTIWFSRRSKHLTLLLAAPSEPPANKADFDAAVARWLRDMRNFVDGLVEACKLERTWGGK